VIPCTKLLGDKNETVLVGKSKVYKWLNCLKNNCQLFLSGKSKIYMVKSMKNSPTKGKKTFASI
jgi:hypothetical protein